MKQLKEAIAVLLLINLVVLPVCLVLSTLIPQLHDVRMSVATKSVILERQCNGKKSKTPSGRKHKI